jgi:hypothetical protein
MGTATSLNDFDLIARYTDQPGRLPASVKQELSVLCEGQAPLAYAHLDLDEQLVFVEHWLVLTQD